MSESDFIGWDVVRLAFNRVSKRPVRSMDDVRGHFFSSGPSKEEIAALPIEGQVGFATTAGAWNKPILSDALSCHPSQVAEFNQHAASAGIAGVHYRQDGTCEIHSRGARKQLMRLRGYHDRDGGYGDG